MSEMPWLSPRLLRLTVKKLGSISYVRNMPGEYVAAAKKTIARRRLDARFGARELVMWDKNPAEYEESAFRPWERGAMDRQEQLKSEERMRVNQARMEPRLNPIQRRLIPDSEWFIFVGDKVKIMVGKDKGRVGKVAAVSREANAVFMEEGLNVERVVLGSEYGEKNAGVSYLEAKPLDVGRGEVRLVEPQGHEEARPEWRLDSETEELRRIDAKTLLELPIPPAAFRTYEYNQASSYTERTKDTPKDVAWAYTYSPSTRTFEEDILNTYGIVDTRTNSKTYFY